MPEFNRSAWQAACFIHSELIRNQQTVPSLPELTWASLETVLRKIRKADMAGWEAAGRMLRTQFIRLLPLVRKQLSESEAELEASLKPILRSSVKEIYVDLCSLPDEFESPEINLEGSEITVITEAICLEGVELGRFQIRLNWNQLKSTQSYEIESLDPNPAAGSDDVVHPHVQDQRLCEGDGHLAILVALDQGRLLDFFVMIRQILETYNDSSPYVSLEKWYGANCQDCGYCVCREDSCRCDHCEVDLCHDCSRSCEDCCRTCCNSCSQSCDGCGKNYCARCINHCIYCANVFCKECLSDETCENCIEEQEIPEEEGEEPTLVRECSQSVSTAVHSLRLGEAAVPERSGGE